MYHRYIGYDITSQARKVSGRAFVLGVPTFPLSRIFLFDFGIVPTVWDFVLFSVLSPRYSGACFNEHIDLWSQLKDKWLCEGISTFSFSTSNDRLSHSTDNVSRCPRAAYML